jgi:hypothetical protein
MLKTNKDPYRKIKTLQEIRRLLIRIKTSCGLILKSINNKSHLNLKRLLMRLNKSSNSINIILSKRTFYHKLKLLSIKRKLNLSTKLLELLEVPLLRSDLYSNLIQSWKLKESLACIQDIKLNKFSTTKMINSQKN